MFATYLWRELTNRKKQTIIIAIGMALAIGLVIVVNAVSAGVRDAQSSVLASVYGVGTDLTVSQEPAVDSEGRPQFDFGSGAGNTDTDSGTTTLAQSRLTAGLGTATFASTSLATVQNVDNVSAATATLSLTNVTFSGQVPDFSQFQGERGPGFGGTAPTAPPTTGGADGAGGSSFSVDSFTVDGIDISGAAVGPLTAVSLADGRTFTAEDVNANVAVLDQTYATSANLAVGGTIAIAGTDFEIIGIVASTSADATSASNVYISLPVAQALSGLTDQVSKIYVQADSSSDIDQIQSDIETALPDNTVSSQADLASSVSGSLSTASSLVSSLGTWLSVIVLAAAFLIAILFTISGVGRRTREFGTLKAIGWRNSMIVRQVAGESLIQGLIGGVLGIAIGLGGIWVINALGITLSGSTGSTSFTGFPGGGQAPTGPPGGAVPGGGAPGFGGFGGGGPSQSAVDVALSAPVTVSVIVLAVGLALLGGLIAGAFGGWRASRLRPAEALRSVA